MVRPRLSTVCVLLAACGGSAGITTLEPVRGSIEGGDPVRIEGAGFVGHGPAVVYVGAEHARGVVVEGDRLIRVLTPPAEAPGEVPVEVHFADGTVYEAPVSFVYEAKGRVLRIDGRRGPR
ncbi:MAG: hypothetical protein D6705_11080 [Deltaproteobacteria bacterium]|nr:MAG: hypothetical protein D6705_11080 [Deltaproteobacteria bacterium]